MIGALISGGASILGSVLGSRANSRAARAQQRAIQQAADERMAAVGRRNQGVSNAEPIMAEGVRQATAEGLRFGDMARGEFQGARGLGIAAIDQGTQRFTDMTQQSMGESLNPGFRLGLTPNQTIAREDMQRRGRQTIAASGLRGAGRAGAAAIMDADRRFMAGAAETNDALNRQVEQFNLNRRTALRDSMGRAFQQRGQQVAGIEMQTGQQVGRSLERSGEIAGRGAERLAGVAAQAELQRANNLADVQMQNADSRIGAAQVGAGAAQANTQLWGNTLGNIAGTAGRIIEKWV